MVEGVRIPVTLVFVLFNKASGAVGEGRDHRTNTRNRQDALVRLAATKKFKDWHKIECARLMGKKLPETTEQILSRVDNMIAEGLQDGSIVIEII